MSISPVNAHSARGADLVALFDAHADLHVRRERAAGPPAPLPAQTGTPSAALDNPARRTIFSVHGGSGTHARVGTPKRHPMRGNDETEAALRSGRAMPGELATEAGAEQHRLDAPIHTPSVPGRRIVNPPEGRDTPAFARQRGVVAATVDDIGKARQAVLGRENWAACLMRAWPSPLSVPA